MKKTLLTLLAAIFALVATAQDQAPAFPGAEGHGRYVTGGRASDGTTKVYHVTTLEDNTSGNIQGSLRWALKQSGPRTIVFDVGGIIELKGELTINANTTIAGQTAPAPGITIRYYTVRPNGDNIIMRYIRIRRGEEKDVNDGADATWARNFTGIILDHCSFSWSIDEVASYYDNNNFTMQWCTLGESLNNPGHSKGAHGYGGIWGGKLASFHHNIILHVNNRSPRFCGARYGWTGYTSNKLYSQYKWDNYVQAENVDFRNCVIYNSGNGCYGGPGGGYVNIANNYYKQGPAATTNRITTVTVGAIGNSEGYPKAYGMTSRYYINGNVMTAKSSVTEDNWSGVTYDAYNDGSSDSKKRNDGVFDIDGYKCSLDTLNFYGDDVTHYKNAKGKNCVRIKIDNPIATGEITTHTAEKAYEKVLANAGASLYRDAVDARYAKEAQDGTATYKGSVTNKWGLIDKVSDQGSYELESTTRPEGFDTDGDGIPDEWETANGLNPNDKSDGNAKTIDTTKGWYTNLEVYLNSLVENIMKAGMEDGESNYTEYWPEYKTTGISTVRTSAITATEYYDLNGRRLSEPQRGVNIRVERMANGQAVTSKVIK